MFKEKNAFVIAGGSDGLGAYLAKEAYILGYPVVIIGRDTYKLKKVKDSIIKHHPNAHNTLSMYTTRLSNQLQTSLCVEDIYKKHKSVSVLVNCAATWMGGKSVLEMSIENMEFAFQENFFTTFYITKFLLDKWNKNKLPLSIINIGATASLRGSKNCSAFSVPKCAIRSFSQSLAKELGPEGVHVAHLVIDGLIGNTRTRKLNPKYPDNKFISMHSLSQTILNLAEQSKDAWTFETDIRPYNESWT